MINEPPFVEYYHGALFFNINVTYDNWLNSRKEPMHGYDWKFFRIGVSKDLFRVENWYYDGHIYKGLNILFMCVGYGITYDWEELKS